MYKQCKFLTKDNLVLFEETKTQVRKVENLSIEIDIKIKELLKKIQEVNLQVKETRNRLEPFIEETNQQIRELHEELGALSGEEEEDEDTNRNSEGNSDFLQEINQEVEDSQFAEQGILQEKRQF